MDIKVISTARDCELLDLKGKTVVVIDVLRSSSVIITALANGASAVVPYVKASELLDVYSSGDKEHMLRCGERNTRKIVDFDLGNSPSEYTSDVVEGKRILLTSTNGTLALKNCSSANKVLVAGFVNISAVVDYIMLEGRNLVIVCAGTNNRFSLEDGLLAGMMIQMIRERCQVFLDDMGNLLSKFSIDDSDQLLSRIIECSHAKKLVSEGFHDDVISCLQIDTFDIVPVYIEGKITK